MIALEDDGDEAEPITELDGLLPTSVGRNNR